MRGFWKLIPSVAATLGCLSTQAALAQGYVYDLRDLGLMLEEDEDEDNPLFELVERLAFASDAVLEGQIVEGVFLIEADEDEQRERFEQLLEQVRELYTENYQVELLVYETEDTPPEIGEAVEPEGEIIFRTTQTLSGSAHTDFAAMRTQAYVASWTPVVANGAVAYEPQLDHIESGVAFRLQIGESFTDEEQVSVRLWGTIIEADIMEFPGPGDPASGEPNLIGLPSIFESPVTAARVIPLNEMIVLSTTTVEEEDEEDDREEGDEGEDEDDEAETYVVCLRVKELVR
jgi:hypothetical protein